LLFHVVRFQVMKLVAEGKPVPEIIETVLKRAAQESGASESAVWERVRKALDKEREATPKASSTVNSDGKESQIFNCHVHCLCLCTRNSSWRITTNSLNYATSFSLEATKQQ
jgi:siderophore synthetase component